MIELLIFFNYNQGVCSSLPRGKGMEVSFQKTLPWARPDELNISMDCELPEDAGDSFLISG